MKQLFKIILALVILSKPFISRAQTNLDIAVSKYIDSLLSKGIDTTITFTNNSYYMPLFESDIKGIGKTNIYGTATIIYFTGQKWNVVKFVDGSANSKPVDRVFLSQNLFLKENDSLYILKTLLRKIYTEQFMPYVYKIDHNGTTGYNILESSQPPIYHITLRSKNDYTDKLVDGYAILEKLEYAQDMPLNLNFGFNRGLSLYPFYLTLNGILSRLDNLFTYK